MKLDFLPGQNELARVPSDDDIFDIAGLDLDSNVNDKQILKQAGVQIDGNSIKLTNSEHLNTLGSYRGSVGMN